MQTQIFEVLAQSPGLGLATIAYRIEQPRGLVQRCLQDMIAKGLVETTTLVNGLTCYWLAGEAPPKPNFDFARVKRLLKQKKQELADIDSKRVELLRQVVLLGEVADGTK